MRGVFSFIGLLVVIAVLAVVARNQMPGMRMAGVQVTPAASSASASSTFEQRSGSEQARQIADEVNKTMQQRQGQIEGQLGLPEDATGASAPAAP